MNSGARDTVIWNIDTNSILLLIFETFVSITEIN